MRRILSTAVRARRALCSRGSGERHNGPRETVQEQMERRQREEDTRRMAEWSSSWLSPWERAHMDASDRPLSFSERLYWRVFLVFATVGIVYETYVKGNRGIFTHDRSIERQMHVRNQNQNAQDDVADHRLLTDDQLRQQER